MRLNFCRDRCQTVIQLLSTACVLRAFPSVSFYQSVIALTSRSHTTFNFTHYLHHHCFLDVGLQVCMCPLPDMQSASPSIVEVNVMQGPSPSGSHPPRRSVSAPSVFASCIPERSCATTYSSCATSYSDVGAYTLVMRVFDRSTAVHRSYSSKEHCTSHMDAGTKSVILPASEPTYSNSGTSNFEIFHVSGSRHANTLGQLKQAMCSSLSQSRLSLALDPLFLLNVYRYDLPIREL